MSALRLQFEFERGEFRLRADAEFGGGVTGICGPSGAGKSTLLALIAGLLRPQRGRLAFDTDVLVDTRRAHFVPAWKRGFGLLFQEGLLFPHLHVRGNLRYGARRPSSASRRFEFNEVVALLEIEPLLQRWPSQLSGGERQRVALGRALLSSPRLLLLDEPLASLDERLKQQILPYLLRIKQDGVPMIYVSHSRDEVTYLADRVLWLHGGRLQETPDLKPRSPGSHSRP